MIQVSLFLFLIFFRNHIYASETYQSTQPSTLEYKGIKLFQIQASRSNSPKKRCKEKQKMKGTLLDKSLPTTLIHETDRDCNQGHPL